MYLFIVNLGIRTLTRSLEATKGNGWKNASPTEPVLFTVIVFPLCNSLSSALTNSITPLFVEVEEI